MLSASTVRGLVGTSTLLARLLLLARLARGEKASRSD
jgi:hypothetical protein